MRIVRWDPVRDLASRQDRINRVFGDFYGGRGDEELTRGEWMPPVDIFENDGQELVIKAELPGIGRDALDLRVENGTLTLRGERKRDNEVPDERYHRVERVHGTFTRSFTLPPTVDAEKVRADYKDGVLTVTLPVREEAKPRQIQVHVN